MFTKEVPLREGYYWISENNRVRIEKLVMHNTIPYWYDKGYYGLHIDVADGQFIYPLPKGDHVYYIGPLSPDNTSSLASKSIDPWMEQYYATFDVIRTEHKTWFPVPDILITKLIDIEIKKRFGDVKWKYDNAPNSLGDFGTEEPFGKYDYNLYKDGVRVIVENYLDNPDGINLTLPKNFLWDMSNVNADHF